AIPGPIADPELSSRRRVGSDASRACAACTDAPFCPSRETHMRFGQHLDLADFSRADVPGARWSGLPRPALIAGAVALGLLTAPPLATAQDRAQNPAQSQGEKNITAQVQKAPAVILPSLNPLVERVLPAVVSITARLNGEAAAGASPSADESSPSTPFDDLLRRFFENRGNPNPGSNPG